MKKKVILLDYFGFEIGSPEIPGPAPRVIVWGNEFFVIKPEDLREDCEAPRYHQTTGYVLADTKEHSNYC